MKQGSLGVSGVCECNRWVDSDVGGKGNPLRSNERPPLTPKEPQLNDTEWPKKPLPLGRRADMLSPEPTSTPGSIVVQLYKSGFQERTASRPTFKATEQYQEPTQ